MLSRNNKVMEEAVKEAIKIYRNEGDFSAVLILKKSKVPNQIINRVIFEPHRIRCTD